MTTVLSIPLMAREVTEEGVTVCGVADGRGLGLLGYHLWGEDEAHNPAVLILKEVGGRVLTVIPVAVGAGDSSASGPVPAVWFGEALMLDRDRGLSLKLEKAPQLAPVRVWGTIWVR